MNTEHTPGPWTLHKHEAYQISYIVRGGEKQNQIAQCFNWQDRGFDVKSEANARLIAAAPDLLEALKATLVGLKEFQRIFGICVSHGERMGGWLEEVEEMITKIEPAIAKAEGKA